MGYFANGTEGLLYQEQWCMRCRNWGADKLSEDSGTDGCPIWDVHLFHSYELCNSKEAGKQILDFLIPRVEKTFQDGITHEINDQCVMFHPRPGMEIPGQLQLGEERQ